MKQYFQFIALILLMSVPLQGVAGSTAPLPGESVYHLDVPLTNQDGKAIKLVDGRGEPRLISMFYASCRFVCPMIIDTIRKTERTLAEPERAKLGVLMVSFDTQKDTPEVLKALAEKRKVDLPNWTLARADEAHVRRLAAVLGIQYKLRDDGEFNHSSVMILLDGEGRMVARTERMGELDPDFVKALKGVLAK